jgi:alcohol dehydrogenase class IV
VPIQSLAGYHKVMRPGLPLIAVPTTAGTGSEVTKVTVITDTERDVKMMMLDAHFTPSVAIVDYELTLSMPPALTAHVGLDTLTHGIEAYVSRKASLLTDALALSCVSLCARYLRRAVDNPNDLKARAAMAAAACQGGLAFANSSVCLVHGMSRPIGAVFHLPHGLSNATLLEVVTRFSLKGAPARYAEIARTMRLCGRQTPDAEACERLTEELASLSRELGVPRLRHCQGVHEARFKQVLPKMALDALASGSPQNNPVVPTAAEIEALYLQAF